MDQFFNSRSRADWAHRLAGDLLKATSAITSKHAGNEFDELKEADAGS